MNSFVIDVDSADLHDRLQELAGRTDNMSPVMHDISLALVAGIEEAFDHEADPVTGTPWQVLQTSTIRQREKKGYWPGKKLQRTGRLASSMVPSSGATFASAGTNVIYAGVMQFGEQRGAAGATKHGVPIPWGTIPARPFAGLSADTEVEILDLMAVYLSR